MIDHYAASNVTERLMREQLLKRAEIRTAQAGEKAEGGGR